MMTKETEKKQLTAEELAEKEAAKEKHFENYAYDDHIYLMINENMRYCIRTRSTYETDDGEMKGNAQITLEHKNADGYWEAHPDNPYIGAIKAKWKETEKGMRLSQTIMKWKHPGVVPDFMKEKKAHAMVFDPSKI